MGALPCVEVVEPAAEEYSEEREERVRFGSQDRVKFEEQVEIVYGRVGHRRGDRV